MQPLASIQSDGNLVFSEKFSKELQEVNGHAFVQQINGATDRHNWIK
jgi:hypothetical protein